MPGLLDRLTVIPIPGGFAPGDFDCEEPDLNDYLRDGQAHFEQGASITRTYLVKDGDACVGYISVLADAIRLKQKERPKGVKYATAPAVKLGRMGLHKTYKRQGVGVWMLKWVIGLARSLSEQVGIRYVTLDALQRDALVAWYEDNGFVRNKEQTRAEKFIRKYAPGQLLPYVSMRFDILLEEEVRQS